MRLSEDAKTVCERILRTSVMRRTKWNNWPSIYLELARPAGWSLRRFDKATGELALNLVLALDLKSGFARIFEERLKMALESRRSS